MNINCSLQIVKITRINDEIQINKPRMQVETNDEYVEYWTLVKEMRKKYCDINCDDEYCFVIKKIQLLGIALNRSNLNIDVNSRNINQYHIDFCKYLFKLFDKSIVNKIIDKTFDYFESYHSKYNFLSSQNIFMIAFLSSIDEMDIMYINNEYIRNNVNDLMKCIKKIIDKLSLNKKQFEFDDILCKSDIQLLIKCFLSLVKQNKLLGYFMVKIDDIFKQIKKSFQWKCKNYESIFDLISSDELFDIIYISKESVSVLIKSKVKDNVVFARGLVALFKQITLIINDIFDNKLIWAVKLSNRFDDAINKDMTEKVDKIIAGFNEKSRKMFLDFTESVFGDRSDLYVSNLDLGEKQQDLKIEICSARDKKNELFRLFESNKLDFKNYRMSLEAKHEIWFLLQKNLRMSEFYNNGQISLTSDAWIFAIEAEIAIYDNEKHLRKVREFEALLDLRKQEITNDELIVEIENFVQNIYQEQLEARTARKDKIEKLDSSYVPDRYSYDNELYFLLPDSLYIYGYSSSSMYEYLKSKDNEMLNDIAFLYDRRDSFYNEFIKEIDLRKYIMHLVLKIEILKLSKELQWNTLKIDLMKERITYVKFCELEISIINLDNCIKCKKDILQESIEFSKELNLRQMDEESRKKIVIEFTQKMTDKTNDGLGKTVTFDVPQVTREENQKRLEYNKIVNNKQLTKNEYILKQKIMLFCICNELLINIGESDINTAVHMFSDVNMGCVSIIGSALLKGIDELMNIIINNIDDKPDDILLLLKRRINRKNLDVLLLLKRRINRKNLDVLIDKNFAMFFNSFGNLKIFMSKITQMMQSVFINIINILLCSKKNKLIPLKEFNDADIGAILEIIKSFFNYIKNNEVIKPFLKHISAWNRICTIVDLITNNVAFTRDFLNIFIGLYNKNIEDTLKMFLMKEKKPLEMNEGIKFTKIIGIVKESTWFVGRHFLTWSQLLWHAKEIPKDMEAHKSNFSYVDFLNSLSESNKVMTEGNPWNLNNIFVFDGAKDDFSYEYNDDKYYDANSHSFKDSVSEVDSFETVSNQFQDDSNMRDDEFGYCQNESALSNESTVVNKDVLANIFQYIKGFWPYIKKLLLLLIIIIVLYFIL